MGLDGIVKLACVAVIVGLTCVPAEAIPAEPSTDPTTRPVAASDSANRRMQHSPFEGERYRPLVPKSPNLQGWSQYVQRNAKGASFVTPRWIGGLSALFNRGG